MVELCVVVALVLVLMLTLLPALAGVRTDSKAAQCRNNLRGLTSGWQMYVSDNLDVFPFRTVDGAMDWTMNPDNTNTTVFADASVSPLARYLRGSDLFKCPADNYLSPLQQGTFPQRVRSVSWNAALGGTTVVSDNQIPGRTYFNARRMTELNKPGPANTVVILDEHPDSIDDAIFQFNKGLAMANAYWRNLPGSHHSGGATISFADGSVMLKRWQDTRTVRPVLYVSPIPGTLNVPGSVDYTWVNDRMPYR